ncbi:hypothetical protein EYC84_008429 [Monilinia fructicola]|uniref:Uncharacterized protein n=1 Tax=Monilinia fructicola TaxID=38448 RepID=A0A5M9JF48_MONFR|nr:hypothetical protein EYC84_008429 [Monilinia fructicola]
MALPNIPASDSGLPPNFQRSQTWSEHPHYMTEAPNAPSQTEAKKASIRQKLENALRNGQMPQYCENCGAIENSDVAARKSNKPLTFFQEMSRVGLPTSYLLIKKALAAGEDQKQYKAFSLCNHSTNPNPAGNDNQNEMRRANSVRPAKKLNAMTSDSASAALRRALQIESSQVDATQ